MVVLLTTSETPNEVGLHVVRFVRRKKSVPDRPVVCALVDMV